MKTYLTGKNIPFVQILRDYMKLGHSIHPVDVMMLPGNSDTTYLPYVAKLYQEGIAPMIICSGKGSPYVENTFGCTEAEYFQRILVSHGVPKESIVLEECATNTGENFRFSYPIMKQHHRNSMLVIQKPFFERRAYATALYESYEGRRPTEILVSSLPVTIHEYDHLEPLLFCWIDMLVGDLHRIKVCNNQGRIIPQSIPDTVLEAFYQLIQLGHNSLLMKGYPV